MKPDRDPGDFSELDSAQCWAIAFVLMGLAGAALLWIAGVKVADELFP